MAIIRKISEPDFDAGKAFGGLSDNHQAEMTTDGILAGMGSVEKDFLEQGVYDELKKMNHKTAKVDSSA